MTRKIIILGICLLVITNVAALATMGFHRWCRDGWWCRDGAEHSEENTFSQLLSLSESQAERIGEHRESFHQEANRASMALLEKRTALVDLLADTEPDSSQIKATLSEISALQAELQENVVCCLLKEKEILSPEQQERYFSAVREMLLHEARCRVSNRLDTMQDTCDEKRLKSSHVKTEERR